MVAPSTAPKRKFATTVRVALVLTTPNDARERCWNVRCAKEEKDGLDAGEAAVAESGGASSRKKSIGIQVHARSASRNERSPYAGWVVSGTSEATLNALRATKFAASTRLPTAAHNFCDA
jgi:hypothetical protein